MGGFMLKKVKVYFYSGNCFRFFVKCRHDEYNEPPLIKKVSIIHKCYICQTKMDKGSRYYQIHGHSVCSQSCVEKVIREENNKRIIHEAKEHLDEMHLSPEQRNYRCTHIGFNDYILPLY